ncbi:MAG: 6-carboxytetrahydropterin synthase [Gammaproteobacteria bacterium]|nr:6-carboxytetrahydropterin synthase [Gammaproteobacteria bacterium]
MSRFAIIEIDKEELKFSAGHFMILSATQRESLHGHDYQVSVALHAHIQQNGMAFDCRYYKQKLLALCKTLDYRFLLPNASDFLTIEESGEHWVCRLSTEQLTFLKKDSIVLPICNATLEELSYWFLQQLTADQIELKEHGIESITLKVHNGRGEAGASQWARQKVEAKHSANSFSA